MHTFFFFSLDNMNRSSWEEATTTKADGLVRILMMWSDWNVAFYLGLSLSPNSHLMPPSM